MILTLALDYGSREEILSAVKGALESGIDPSSLGEEEFGKFLYTKDLPKLDLVIRTSGEMRLSNFLLWQIAYAELVFLDVLWPDFKPQHLYKSIYLFQNRQRRYGGI
jgi:undecaprenyl diphosphate synthase